jgi:sec-independent protein translocase protein TatA
MGLGLTEWLVILAIVVLLFGARKLPELAHSMGASVQAFKKGMKDTPEEPAKPKEQDKPTSNGHAH